MGSSDSAWSDRPGSSVGLGLGATGSAEPVGLPPGICAEGLGEGAGIPAVATGLLVLPLPGGGDANPVPVPPTPGNELVETNVRSPAEGRSSAFDGEPEVAVDTDDAVDPDDAGLRTTAGAEGGTESAGATVTIVGTEA